MKNRNIVRQNYQLVNAKYKLSTSEIKFVMIALTQLEIDDDDFKDYEIKVSELEAKLQAEQNETRLKQFAKKMMSKPLEVPTDDGWIVANWFADVEYVRGSAKFKVSFSKKLKPYLLELKGRIVIHQLKYIINLSSYSIRIYQMLKEYENFGVRKFNVVELQQVLQVPNSYKEYSKFKQAVLNIAQKEMDEYTDITFIFEEEKEGKKVVDLIFKIIKNKKVKQDEEEKKYGSLIEFEESEIPEIIYGHKGIRGIKKENYYVPFSDGSFKILFEDGSEKIFKSLKQFEYAVNNFWEY